jgi:DNA modification methylase
MNFPDDYINQIVLGDCLDVMKEFPDNCISGIVTDPPYGLTFMNAHWDKGVPGPKFWSEMLRIAKPGAYLMGFGGTRTWHRLACAIEDAGWKIKDCLMFLHAQGFPKSCNISANIDKHLGAKREIVGMKTSWNKPTSEAGHATRMNASPGEYPATLPATLWDGYGSALKPAVETILLCQKPISSNSEDLEQFFVLVETTICLLLSYANDAENLLKLNQAKRNVESFVDILVDLRRGDRSLEKFVKMDMFNSPEMVSTCLNIAWLWKVIYQESLHPGNTCITLTGPEMTTGLRILKSFLLMIIPDFIIQDVKKIVGDQPSANNVVENSREENSKPNSILKRFVAGSVTWKTRENGTPANNAVLHLLATIPLVYSVLQAVMENIERQDKLFPDWEPIILAMKPVDGTYAQNALKWGVAGLNVDEGRIGGNADWSYPRGRGGKGWGGSPSLAINLKTPMSSTKGRWPANLILSHAPGCTDEGCIAECPVRMLDEQSGVLKSGAILPTYKTRSFQMKNTYGVSDGGMVKRAWPADSGGASRFFYCAKASPSERGSFNTHSTVKPLSLMKYLVTLLKMPETTLILDPFSGSGSTCLACHELGIPFIGIEREEKYVEIARRRIKESVPSLFMQDEEERVREEVRDDMKEETQQTGLFDEVAEND